MSSVLFLRRGLAGAVVVLLSLCLAEAASAQDRVRLGYGRLFINDSMAAAKDRWHTGGLISSRIWGQHWDGEAPEKPGEIIEFRWQGRVIAPSNLRAADPDDRRYAGVLSLGLHTHFQRGGIDFATGGDLVLTGPQTHIDEFHAALHDVLDIAPPSEAVFDNQIGNGIHPTFVGEAARSTALGSAIELRPFAELRLGDETLARAGFDMTFGGLAFGGLRVREPVTGQRYEVIPRAQPGYSFVLGGDIAQVQSSVYLPEDDGPVLSDVRSRVRAGVHWQGEVHSVFYGLTYLGEEFEGQEEGQFVGAARIRLTF
ncbi:lipid A-modifier LpxR family protein [Litorisediminicola beolgyonensis]|uniref:Lipid A-modifier LpxR family protein n=1 Tax=Litorisediminicola beolgyonensis TaxID=1173614 RepID=A0ABW3ZKQ7_9RHOB